MYEVAIATYNFATVSLSPNFTKKGKLSPPLFLCGGVKVDMNMDQGPSGLWRSNQHWGAKKRMYLVTCYLHLHLLLYNSTISTTYLAD